MATAAIEVAELKLQVTRTYAVTTTTAGADNDGDSSSESDTDQQTDNTTAAGADVEGKSQQQSNVNSSATSSSAAAAAAAAAVKHKSSTAAGTFVLVQTVATLGARHCQSLLTDLKQLLHKAPPIAPTVSLIFDGKPDYNSSSSATTTGTTAATTAGLKAAATATATAGATAIAGTGAVSASSSHNSHRQKALMTAVSPTRCGAEPCGKVCTYIHTAHDRNTSILHNNENEMKSLVL
jgi:hypothetical protein